MLTYIIIAIIVQLFGVYRALKVKNDYQAFSAILTVTSSICIGILTFPYFLLDGDDVTVTAAEAVVVAQEDIPFAGFPVVRGGLERIGDPVDRIAVVVVKVIALFAFESDVVGIRPHHVF